MTETVKVYSRPKTLIDRPWHFCPGCHHGIAHRLCAEVIEEMGLQEKTIGVGSVGCGVFSYEYFNFDGIGPSHGRSLGSGHRVKRVCRTGSSLLIKAMVTGGDWNNRNGSCRGSGEKITIVLLITPLYGMTGGQLAPTTLMGQVTTTSPWSRSEQAGFPDAGL